MSTIIIIITTILPVFIFMWTKRTPRWVKLDSRWQSLRWTWRLMRCNFSFPETLEEWQFDQGLTIERIMSVKHAWDFVRPFFASRGYTMYEKDPISEDLWVAPFPTADKNASYPYARQIPTNKREGMGWESLPIWGARDARGRDVVLKVISEVDNPSQELKVMQRLNCEKLRSHPHNHTIYALEFITFDKFVFVVMPRWDCAFWPEFATVSELVFFALTCFQTFAFLHHNRIVHCDFLPQNIGMNALMNLREWVHRPGLRDPKDVRYALYDFGASIAYPEDIALDDPRETRYLNFDLHGVPSESIKGPYNPFKLDMAFLGTCLQRYVRHIENIVPELGPFFDMLVDPNDPNQLTARQALTRFAEIYEGLSPEAAGKSFDTWQWSRDESGRRKKLRNLTVQSPIQVTNTVI